MSREPNAIIDAIVATITLLTAFGWTITPAQTQAITGLVAALIILATWIIGLLEKRKRVTPVATPMLPVGSRVVVTDPATPAGQDPVLGALTLRDPARVPPSAR